MSTQPHVISEPTRISWIDLEALSVEPEWRHKALALQCRRWQKLAARQV